MERRKSSSRAVDEILPRDDEAERAAIGSVLYGAENEALSPDLILHEGRRALLLAALLLRTSDWPAAVSDHPRDQIGAARARAERVAAAVRQAATWNSDESPNYELLLMIESVTHGDHLDYYVGRLVECWRRREALDIAERIRRAAHDLSSNVSEVISGIDFDAIANGGPRRTSAVLLPLSDVSPQPVNWLWPGRIARGKLTLLAGQPGLGKSLLTVDLSARVSRGWGWPDRSPATDGPGDVILLTAEDDPADTIRPRLDAAGADVNRIAILRAVHRRDEETGEVRERSLSLVRDLSAVKDALRQRPDCQLLIVDPVSAYMSGTDTHRNSDVRGVLAPLSELAAERDVAVLIISHLNKGGDGTRPALDRVNGSGAFAAAARAVYIVGRDPDDPERRIVATAKNNLGPDSDGLAYSLKIDESGVPILIWEPEPVKTSAETLLLPPDRDAKTRRSALSDATQWLREELSQGPQSPKDLQDRCRSDGHSWGTVRRAKDELQVTVEREGYGTDGRWVWKLPTTEES